MSKYQESVEGEKQYIGVKVGRVRPRPIAPVCPDDAGVGLACFQVYFNLQNLKKRGQLLVLHTRLPI